MKNFILIVVLVLLFSPKNTSAQLLLGGQDLGFSFGYSNGVNFPELEFSKEDLSKLPLSRLSRQDTTKLNGYAQGIVTSFHFDFYAAYRIIPHVSIMAAVSEDQNTYDINTLNTQYQSFFPPNATLATTGDNYIIVQYLAGAYFNFPLSAEEHEKNKGQNQRIHVNPLKKNISFELKILGGLTTANYPNLYYLGLSQTVLYTMTSGYGFGFFAGGGLKYEIINGIGIHLNVNYAYSGINYPSYTVSVFSGNSYASTQYNEVKSMTLGLLQIAAGISIDL